MRTASAVDEAFHLTELTLWKFAEVFLGFPPLPRHDIPKIHLGWALKMRRRTVIVGFPSVKPAPLVLGVLSPVEKGSPWAAQCVENNGSNALILGSIKSEKKR
jgi:hypothetical protein